jgi:cell division cycle protein 20 (cofactor of APC complex)
MSSQRTWLLFLLGSSPPSPKSPLVAHSTIRDFPRSSLHQANETASPSKTDAQKSLQGALFNDGAPAKILAFKQAPPKPTAGFQSEHAVLFTQSKENASRLATKVLRHISQTPERILDAPELKQDFYLNLLAWSTRDVIAVALSETVRSTPASHCFPARV